MTARVGRESAAHPAILASMHLLSRKNIGLPVTGFASKPDDPLDVAEQVERFSRSPSTGKYALDPPIV